MEWLGKGSPGWWGLLLLVCSVFLVVGCPARGPETPAGRGVTVDKSRLPWWNDPEFAKARKDNGTPVLVASYQASLPDPILFERHNIALAADYLKGAVIRPGEVFSLNARIGPRLRRRGFKPGPEYRGNRIVPTVGGGVCKIASVMYNVVVLANLPVVERHPHSMTVPYVPPGQDATISYGAQDFKFRNTTGSPLLVWARNTGDTLYVALYGVAKPPRVKWVHRLLHKGSDRVVVHSWVVVTYAGGRTVRKDMGVSAYRPEPEGISAVMVRRTGSVKC